MTYSAVIGLGVAGNFAGHLEQAGEARDFVAVKVKEAIAPKAIFPFYLPKSSSFLGTYPLSHSQIRFPTGADNLQIEPEVGLLCDITYDHGQVIALTPKAFGAYNDCSIRKEGARKISEKKNWGPESKGVAEQLLPLDTLQPGGVLDGYRIASFLLRDGQVHPYGIDSPVVEYSYFHQTLLDWIVEKMNEQLDEGPAEHIAALLAAADYPSQALISIGATRYTPFGEKNFLQLGDRSLVLLYPAADYTPAQILARVEAGEIQGEGISALLQEVV
ncbi:MAG: DUF5718 family protein [Aeromonadaceae bacterium]